mgnify:CR=1 FL=1
MRALLLEDDPVFAGALTRAVRALGSSWEVCVADTVGRALEAVGQSDDGLQLALVDMNLPDGSGLDVIRSLRQQRPDVPALVVSSLSSERSVLDALEAAGLGPVRAELRRAPAWTTDWITEQGRQRLLAYGIAPPGACGSHAGEGAAVPREAPIRFMPRRDAAPGLPQAIACPRCGSHHTEQLSAFGSTACKSLWRCVACREPFEHFKPI